MGSSSGTKANNKLSSSTDIIETKRQQKAMLALESVCTRILESRPTSKQDIDSLMWQRKLHNIVTPVSLALTECKGPRHFHYHYKHSKKDDGILQPVLENPIELLVQVCTESLKHAEISLVGISDEKIIRYRDSLEAALRNVILECSA